MPTKKFSVDQMLDIRSSAFSLPADLEAFGFVLEEVTLRKEDVVRKRALKVAAAKAENKEKSNDK